MCRMYLVSWLLLLLGASFTSPPVHVEGARILAAYVFPGKSHFMIHNVLVRELVGRGHEVTFITPFSLANEGLGGNYTEVLIPVYDFWKDVLELFNAKSIFELSTLSGYDYFRMMRMIGQKTTEFALQQPNIQALINSEGRYDLLLAEKFFNEAMLALGYKYNVPIISTTTFTMTGAIAEMTGVITPWAYVPHVFVMADEEMDFVNRLTNTVMGLVEEVFRRLFYQRDQEALVRKYFGHLPIEIPTISQMEANLSAWLINTYTPLFQSQPTSINTIQVGGLHIDPPKKLPVDMQAFLDGAKDGAIYFSLGTNVRSSEFSPELRRMFFEVFKGLKQRVLWKFEDENIANVPANVMIKKWMPQSDILAHPNVRLFITHGGLFGTMEAVHYGKPFLGIPVYCDQFMNMDKAVRSGYALMLRFKEITKDKLEHSLRELLENPKYTDQVEWISRTFRDRPMSPRDTAMYWIEYVIRHKGAPHLRSAGKNLKWYQFYLLDVMLVLLLIILMPFCGLIWFVRRCLRPKSQKLKIS